MKIHDGHNANAIRQHILSQQAQPSAGNVSNLKGSGVNAASNSIDTSSLEGLTKLLAGGSEVRETLVQEIKLKIQVGEYLTQKSAVDTADAILNL